MSRPSPRRPPHLSTTLRPRPPKAGAKAAGVVIDDAAVTPRYVTGFTPERELPAIARIAVGSLRNKLLILLPAALGLAVLAPWLITPLLMLGGAYLCYEGAEKVFEAVLPHHAGAHEAEVGTIALDAASVEDQKVASAIKTDFILSAEIMAIALASIPSGSFWMQAVVLAVVGLGITVAVYGVVGLIVKADDIGLVLARNGSASALAGLGRAVGRGLVRAMPLILALLSIVGTAAMIWVGGGIVVHGLEAYGLHAIAGFVQAAAGAIVRLAPVSLAGTAEWLVSAIGAGFAGLLIGGALIPLVGFVLAPAWRGAKSVVRRAA